MSTHPSLKPSGKSGMHRSVLKRLERVMHLIKKDKWKEGDSVLGLPKIKTVKFKIKKEKTKEAEAEVAAAAEGVAATATAAAQPAAGDKKGPEPSRKGPEHSGGKDAAKK